MEAQTTLQINTERSIPYEDMYRGKSFKFGRGFTIKSKIYERNFDAIPNFHVGIFATSGGGKTTTVKPLIQHYQENKKTVYVIDPKKNGMQIDGENLFIFSARNSKYSLPIFEFDHHKENGGVIAEAQEIVRLLKKYFFPSLKENQTAVLLQLTIDTYRLKGFLDEDDTGWTKGLNLNDKNEKIKWLKLLPTMEELYENLEYFLALYKDGGSDVVSYHNELMKKADKILGKEDRTNKDLEKLKKLKDDAIISYENHWNYLINQCEDADNKNTKYRRVSEAVEDIEFYADKKAYAALETLKLKLKYLINSGVFGSNLPPVTRGVNRFDISGLPVDIQCFFTEIIANKLDRSLRFRGEYLNLPEEYRKIYGAKFDTVLVIDEAQLVLPKGRDANDHSKGLIRINAEGRGRGLAMVILTQSPNNVPETMLRNIGTKIILKTEPVDYSSVVKLLGVDKLSLDRIYDTFGTCLVNINNKYETIALPWVKI